MRISRYLLQLPKLLAITILFQAVLFVCIALQISTMFVWIFAILSFVPPVLVCFLCKKNGYVILSLVLLFVSQQAILVFENPSWGFAYGSDAINDFHITSLMSGISHFELGNLGYASRTSYSYFPMMHLFSVLFSDVSAIPLSYIALYSVPFLNAFLVTIALFYLNSGLFGLQGRERNIATLFFEVGFYYTVFQSQSVRETFAFPFVLLTIMLLFKTIRSDNRSYALLIFIMAVVVTLSHQVTSYLFVMILALLAFVFTFFNKNRRSNVFFLFGAVILSIYTAFVTLSFSSGEWTLALEGLQALVVREGSPTIMASSSRSSFYLSIVYYAIIMVLLFVGGLKLLREKRKNPALLVILAFFTIFFIFSILLRLSTSADPWSWTYYMGLRGTIWAFVGISCVAAVGLVAILKMTRSVRKAVVLLVILTCLLAAGKLAQSGSLVTNSADQPVTRNRYVSALWLRGVTIHGSNMFVAPQQVDPIGFEAARDMAPYAYLKEYFVDEEHGHSFNRSSGYLAFVSFYFDQYRNSTDVQTIYSNGPTTIGYEQPS